MGTECRTLDNPALLPFASLTATTQPQTLLQQVVQRVNQLEEAKKPEIVYPNISGVKIQQGFDSTDISGGNDA